MHPSSPDPSHQPANHHRSQLFPTLSPTIQTEIMPGHWKLLIDPHTAPRYLEAMHSPENIDRIEDFQLSTASLEDLYLSLINTGAVQ